MPTVDKLRARATELREAGDRTAARQTDAQATTLDLQAAQGAVLAAEAAADAARVARGHVIADALDAGWSYSRIARATGLSHQRVRQLATGAA